MIFKCESCNDWNDGTGTDKCLKCTEFKYVGYEKSRIVVEYYPNPYEEIPAPQDWEALYMTSRNNTIWELINQLDWREATMVTQYYFLEMKQADIAEYHGISVPMVNKIIKKSIEKTRKL